MVFSADPASVRKISDGGSVPGLPGQSAFRLITQKPSPIPVLIAVPHAGRAYPPSVSEAMRMPDPIALRLEDRLVDRLAEKIAEETQASLLIADAPRAMIDLNRGTDEVDWSMIAQSKTGEQNPESDAKRPQGRRVRSGLGLVPRRLAGIGEIWREPMSRDELDHRIGEIHTPYHAALSAELERLKDRWGAALLLDLHSMPPLQQDYAPKFVLGDRFGAACAAMVSSAVIQYFERQGQRIAQNRPYAGGYVLDRHSAPRRSLHAVQLEVCRSRYLDAQLNGLGEGAEQIIELVSGLVRTLAGEIAGMGTAQTRKLAAE